MTRTYPAAFKIARAYAGHGGPAEATRVLSSLLWHADSEHGGFIGLSDAALQAKCETDPRLSYDEAVKAMYAPMKWPVERAEEIAA